MSEFKVFNLNNYLSKIYNNLKDGKETNLNIIKDYLDTLNIKDVNYNDYVLEGFYYFDYNNNKVYLTCDDLINGGCLDNFRNVISYSVVALQFVDRNKDSNIYVGFNDNRIIMF